jgi:hypothetical protein
MKRIHGLRYAAALLGLLAGTTMMGAQSNEPSLGDVARKKSAAKARKVVTNDEIPPSPEANNPTPSAPAAWSAGAAPDVKADTRKDGEQAATSAEKQTRLQALMKEVDSLKTIVKTLQDQIDATNDENRIETLSQVLQHAKESLLQNQNEMDKLKAGAAGADQSDGTQASADQPPSALQPPTAEQPPAPK